VAGQRESTGSGSDGGRRGRVLRWLGLGNPALTAAALAAALDAVFAVAAARRRLLAALRGRGGS